MKRFIAIVALLGSPVLADNKKADKKIDFNLKDYKVKAVQPVLGARGTASADLAAIAASQPGKANPQLASTGSALRDGKGFGFAGKAGAQDFQLLGLGLGAGMYPTLQKADPAKAKESVTQIRGLLPKLKGKVDAKVIAALDSALALGEAGDNAGAMKGLIDAMMASVEAITKGTERTHAYLAIGLYIGIATAWTENGKQSTALASLAEPLEKMLEEDALMGGADRAISAQLKVIAADLASPTPTTEKLAAAVNVIAATKPD